MAIRISGMNSGLDTDSIVQALVMDVKTKKESYEKKKTKLEWTQEIWKGINSNVYSLYNKVNNMRWTSAYSLKKTTVSDATKASVTASNTAVTGTQKLNILSVAQSGYLTGGKLSTTAATGTTLAELGYSGGDATINVDKGDGTSASITVSASTTIAELTEALGKQGLNASLDTTNNRIFVSSKQTGVKNDFNLIAGDENGLKALKSLGLTTSIGDGTATQATYTKYGTYAMTAEGTVITDESVIKQNIEAALAKYKDASAAYAKVTTQIENIKLAAQGYGSAYAATQDFYSTYGFDSGNSIFKSVSLMSSSARTNTVIADDGTEYTKISKKDADGNEVYSTKNADGTTSYVKKIETYTDADNNVYTKKENGSYVRTDAEGNEITYSGDTADLKKHVAYYAASEKITGKTEEKDGEGNAISYTVNPREITGEDGSKKTQYYIKKGDVEYVSDTLTGEFKNGEDVVKIGEVTYDYTTGAADNTIKAAADRYDEYKDKVIEKLKADGKTEEEAKASADSILSTFAGNLANVNSFEKQASVETAEEQAAANSKTALMNEIQAAYANAADDKAGAVKTLTESYIAQLTDLVSEQTKQKGIMDENDAVASLADFASTSQEYATALNKMIQTAKTGATVLNDKTYTASAVKIDGSDAEIKLNGVKYTSDTNNITVNGITVTAMGITGDGDENAITINTQTDAQGIYDKIKEFFTEYNKVINELCKQYNAEYVKDYEPLTDEEKEEMSDKEIEKWEEKIKGSLLRHDSTVSSVMNAMTSAMFGSVEVNGKTYSLASFGIQTLGYLNAAKNEHYAYHIDGDEDDDVTSGKDDKLMAMINSDPDTVVDFFKQLSTNLYQALDTKMKSTSMNSAYTIYSDKQMTKDLDSYTKLIKTWEEKLEDREEYYYKKFTAMEKAMASLNSTQSSLSGYFQ